MDPQTQVSKNVVDRRGAATHGLAALIGILLGFLGRPAASPPAGSPDADLVAIASAALDRGQSHLATVVPGWHDARLVIFTEREATPCGWASAQSGPFWCDGKLYLDPAFLRAIRGDLARAYVVEHELGHHVQAVAGWQTTGVERELQADCIAGDLMRVEQEGGHLAAGDLEGALEEARAVGDDRICPGCSPETWTHGSGEQRSAAVLRGYNGEDCGP